MNEKPESKTQPLTKMTSGAEELRDHDFPVTQEQARQKSERATVDTGAMPRDQIRSGGKNGEVEGDKQRFGDVGTIMDQDAVDPANFDDN